MTTAGVDSRCVYIVSTTGTTNNTNDALVRRDSAGNIQASNLLITASVIVTAAGTTTLSISSRFKQIFTGTTTQTVVLPTTFVNAGFSWKIYNRSTGTVTVQSSSGDTVQALASNTQAEFTAISNTPTTSAHWVAG